MTTALTPGEQIKDLLDQQGWWHDGSRGPNGEVCLLVAWRRIGKLQWRYLLWMDEVKHVIEEQYPDRVHRQVRCLFDDQLLASVSVGHFNDHPDTTFADIERVIEKADVRLAEVEANLEQEGTT